MIETSKSDEEEINMRAIQPAFAALTLTLSAGLIEPASARNFGSTSIAARLFALEAEGFMSIYAAYCGAFPSRVPRR
jgi:hypothetical protein